MGCSPHLDKGSEDMQAIAEHLQKGHGHQQGQWDQQDQQDPGESRESIRTYYSLATG